jgi:hypothetical protein
LIQPDPQRREYANARQEFSSQSEPGDAGILPMTKVHIGIFAKRRYGNRRNRKFGTGTVVANAPSVQPQETEMPRGDKSSYSNKQKRQAEHIEEGYKKRGTSSKTAASRAWATVNKETGGAKGGGKKKTAKKKSTGRKTAAKKGGRKKTAGRKSAAKKSSRSRK